MHTNRYRCASPGSRPCRYAHIICNHWPPRSCTGPMGAIVTDRGEVHAGCPMCLSARTSMLCTRVQVGALRSSHRGDRLFLCVWPEHRCNAEQSLEQCESWMACATLPTHLNVLFNASTPAVPAMPSCHPCSSTIRNHAQDWQEHEVLAGMPELISLQKELLCAMRILVTSACHWQLRNPPAIPPYILE